MTTATRRKGGELPTANEIAVYTRVSTEEQAAKPESSLDNQRHRCCQYLMAHGAEEAGMKDVRVYREEGFSGKDTKRPQLQQLLRDIKDGRVRLLVFTELSRVSRSVQDFLALSKFFEDYSVQFICLKERFDTTTPHGRLIMVVLVALYAFERETVSLRTIAALRDRAERGLFNGGQVPVGYTPNKDTGGLTIVPEESVIIREAYRLYLELGSVSQTQRALRDRGYKRLERTSRREKVRPAGHLSWNNVDSVLTNPAYIGLKKVNAKAEKLPEEERLALPEEERYRLVPAVWKPIVDDDLFKRAQELREENRIRTANSIAPKDYDYVLQGIVRCGTCDAILQGASSKKQRYHYYRHPVGTRVEECGQSSWRAEFIEDAVLGRLSRLADDEELLALVIQRANQRIDDNAPEKREELRFAVERRAKLVSERDGLMSNLMSAPAGSVPASFWSKAKKMEADVEAAESEVARLEREVQDIQRSKLRVEDYRNALKKFRQVYGHLDAFQQSELLAYVLDRVELTADEMTIGMLGEVPEVGRYEKGANGEYRQPLEWLPIRPDRRNQSIETELSVSHR